MVHRRHDIGERAPDVIVHDSPIFTYCAVNDALRWGQRKVGRNIADLLDTCRLELHAALGAEPRKLVDAVIRHAPIAGAVGVQRTLVRDEAVLARRDVRCSGFCEHRVHRAYLRTDGVQERARLVEHRVQLEERLEIEPHAVVDVVPVEREYPGIANVESRAAQHPDLDGHIEDEDVLEPCG